MGTATTASTKPTPRIHGMHGSSSCCRMACFVAYLVSSLAVLETAQSMVAKTQLARDLIVSHSEALKTENGIMPCIVDVLPELAIVKLAATVSVP